MSTNSTPAVCTAKLPQISVINIKGLRRVRDKVPWRLWMVAIIGCWEKAAFWGLTAPWQNYMEHPSHYGHSDTPGALGLGQAMATRVYCAFFIFYYITPVVFAIISDSYLGRYKTLIISVCLYCVGCTMITLSSIPQSLNKGFGIPGLALAMVLVGLGGGGFRAIMIPFIADQLTETEPRLITLRSGEQVVTDYSLTLQYIYNLYYWLNNVGSLSSFATVCLEKQFGFTAAYGLTLAFMIITMIILLGGRRWFVRVPCEGNVLPQASKIIACAVRNGFKMQRAYPEYQTEHRQKPVSWSSQLVDELSRGLRACRVLLAFVMWYICFDQMQNNLISQASQMRTYGTPNDLLPATNQLFCVFLGPLVQEVLYPFLHRHRIYIKPIMRMVIGFIFMAFSMTYAAAVQKAIYNSPPCYDHPKKCDFRNWDPAWGSKGNAINVWVQLPIYGLLAISEIFAYVTGLEYAYDNSPKDMMVLVQAISLLLGGVGSGIAMALTPIAHDPQLVLLYVSLAIGMGLCTVVFWIVFGKYEKINNIEIGGMVHIVPENLANGSDEKDTGTVDAREHGSGGPNVVGPLQRQDSEIPLLEKRQVPSTDRLPTNTSKDEEIALLQIPPVLASTETEARQRLTRTSYLDGIWTMHESVYNVSSGPVRFDDAPDSGLPKSRYHQVSSGHSSKSFASSTQKNHRYYPPTAVSDTHCSKAKGEQTQDR